jgi:hypothetical protein
MNMAEASTSKAPDTGGAGVTGAVLSANVPHRGDKLATEPIPAATAAPLSDTD